ncbi:MAG: hypothetical protein HY791_29315 [Deltaproteobacteria bacterium]|nr:hypothetical protein [Deltaproteobacteria bacterium]
MDTLERVAEVGNLMRAFDRIKKRGSAPGIDRVDTDEWSATAESRAAALSRSLLESRYRPKPARRIRLKDDPDRPITIPTIDDRVVQRAIAQVLGPIVEPTLSEAAWAYRPGRSAFGALELVEQHLRTGFRFYLRTDVAKFFDRIPQPALLAQLAELVPDGRIVSLVGLLVRANVLEGAAFHLQTEGVPQGSGLSPVLSNVYLRALDRTVIERGYPFIRYADDMLVLAETDEVTAHALDLIARTLAGLGLTLGAKKTLRGHVGDGFTFLGVRFGPDGRGPAKKAIEAMTARAIRLSLESPRASAPRELRELAARWATHHGNLASTDVHTLPALLGALLLNPSRERVFELLAQRRVLSVDDSPPWVHVELARTWLRHGMHEGWLIEARSAIHRGISSEDRGVLFASASIPESVTSELLSALAAKDSMGLASALGTAGAKALARAARKLDERSVPGPALQPAPQLEQLLLARLPGRPDAARDHLAGKTPLAIHLVLANRTMGCACITVGVIKKTYAGADVPAALLGQAHDMAAALVRVAKERRIASLLEDDGHRDRRVWFPFNAPISVPDARALLVRLCSEAGPGAPDIRRELVPSTDVVEGMGPLIPLPLGTHPRSGRPSRFVDLSGAPLDPGVELGKSGTFPETVYDLVRRGPLAPDRGTAKGQSLTEVLREWPRALRVALGCERLGRLVEKARDLGYLDGIERATVREVLLPLGDQGRQAAAAVNSLGGAARRDTERVMESTDAERSPISCTKVRARHGEGCACPFRGLYQGTYPTPSLHVLAPGEVPAFAKLRPRRAPPSPPPPEAKSAEGERSLPDDLYGLVSRLAELTKQAGELEKSKREIEAKLAEHFDREGANEIWIDIGMLVRERKGDRWRFRIELRDLE